MTNHFGNPSPYFQPNEDWAAYELAPAFGRKRVFLVAIEGEQLPPAIQGTGPLQRVHVMMVKPGEAIQFDSPLSVLSALPELPPEMVPAYRVGGELPRFPRPVRGELLRDERGHFYERVEGQIRPLHQLASGLHGEVLNLTPSSNPIMSQVRRPPARPTILEVEEMPFQEQSPLDDFAKPREPEVGQSPGQRFGSGPAPTTCRNLFPEPGQWRLVRWVDFKEVLRTQVAHPERLRDSHRLPCCLQIYEVMQAQHLESLAAALLGRESLAEQLHPLSEFLAAKLGVTALARTHARTRRYFRREPGLFLPGDFVFRLQLESDPTEDAPAEVSRAPQADSEPAQTPASKTVSGGRAAAEVPQRKNSVPARYLKPWEFQLSREEALYDMNAEAASTGVVKSLFARLRNWLSGGNSFRKWQVLLWGKTPEEQLWGVRPPKGGRSNPAIRDWARKTLELAGYDPVTMLREWEVFWRQKGF